MKELQPTFTGRGEVRGFLFTQLQKSDKGYLYEVDTGTSKHYEVFERIENIRFNSISYPQSKSFGNWAWCITDYKQALNKFEKITLKN